MNTIKTTKMVMAAVVMLGFAGAARAQSAADAARADITKTLGFAPQFLTKLPEAMLPGAWEELKGLQLNPNTALSGKSKELVGLAVAAQVPCTYCIVAHTEFAKLNGANDTEIGEAVGMAAITRHWSTYLNGIQTDAAKFRAEITRLVDNAKKGGGGGKPAVHVTDGATALQEITNLFGFAPDFLRRFPEAGRAGAWKQMRDLQMNPKTALSGKDKELIGLAVAAQVPCQFCVVAHTEFAKLNGATDAEINEALGMAAITRNMSTMLNGLQLDAGQFRRDVDRLVKGVKAKARSTAKASASGGTR